MRVLTFCQFFLLFGGKQPRSATSVHEDFTTLIPDVLKLNLVASRVTSKRAANIFDVNGETRETKG